MRRLVALLVIIFAFAAVAGPTTAHAHRYTSTPIVVLNHVDEHNQSIPVMLEVQRGNVDLGSGITMPCGGHQAIPVSVPQLPARPTRESRVASTETILTDGPGTTLLRPPQQA